MVCRLRVWVAGSRSRLSCASIRSRCVFAVHISRYAPFLSTLTQSVETYSKKTGARVGESQPKRVVEYLVFQKRMWFDSPWVVRDRLYEGLESRFSVPQYA